MKFLKYAGIALLVAVITDFSIAAAYPSPSATVTGIAQLPSNKDFVYTIWLTKNKDGLQKYLNRVTYTWLTDPCKDCIIGTKPSNEYGVTWEAITTKMGEEQAFTSNIATVMHEPFGPTYNNYRLGMFRVDYTLLTTNHGGTWTINP